MKERTVYVLFGATGDLAQRKIVPALASLFEKGELQEDFHIVAFSRRPWNDEEYREFIGPALQKFPAATAQKFLQRISYIEGTFDENAGFQKLKEIIGDSTAYFHLAIQPEFYEKVMEQIGSAGLKGNVLIEKPFGHDAYSAQMLEATIEKHFSPEQIFRIDHYLGKAGLRNVLNERMNDPAFETRLTNEFVEKIEVNFLESIDIEGRGEFYDATGALRDVVQNHVLSMLATLCMNLEEAKISESRARAHFLQSLIPAQEILRAQYHGYHEHALTEESITETYVSLQTSSKLPHWSGVPIMLTGGKALHEKRSDIVIYFKDGTQKIWNIDEPKIPDAYETIIAAALSDIKNKNTYFQNFEEVKAAWQLIDHVRAQFSEIPLVAYPKGSAIIGHG